MFGPLAEEKRNRQVAADHVSMIREMAEDVISDEYTGDEIDVSELDTVMSDDEVSKDDESTLDTLIGSVVGEGETDISTLTKDEIRKTVASVRIRHDELDS